MLLRTAEGRALLAAARQPLTPSATVVAEAALARPADLLAAARYHRLMQVLHHHVKDVRTLDADLRSALRHAHFAQVEQGMRAEADLAALADSFDAAEIAWVTVKGAALSHRLYGARPALRASSDLDVVVTPDTVGPAVTLLVDSGARLVGPPWALLRERRVAQLSLLLPAGTLLDLHWDLFSLPFAREAFRWPVREVVPGSATVQIAGRHAPTLDTEDTLIHLCAHAALSGASRLGRLVDLALLVGDGLDWDVLIARARQRGAHVACAAMLERIRRVLLAPVPSPALDSLLPRLGWRTLLRCGDALRPPSSAEDGHWTLEAVYRSTRQSVPISALQLARTLGARVGGGLSLTDGKPWEDGDSVLAPDGYSADETRQVIAALPWY